LLLYVQVYFLLGRIGAKILCQHAELVVRWCCSCSSVYLVELVVASAIWWWSVCSCSLCCRNCGDTSISLLRHGSGTVMALLYYHVISVIWHELLNCCELMMAVWRIYLFRAIWRQRYKCFCNELKKPSRTTLCYHAMASTFSFFKDR
jgi:hypothetical protein